MSSYRENLLLNYLYFHTHSIKKLADGKLSIFITLTLILYTNIFFNASIFPAIP